MRGLVWTVAVVAGLIWSAIAWAGHGILGLAGRFVADVAGTAPVSPDDVAVISEWSGIAAGLGQGAVTVIWAIGILIIAGLAALVLRLMRRPMAAEAPDGRFDGPAAGGAGAMPGRPSDRAPLPDLVARARELSDRREDRP